MFDSRDTPHDNFAKYLLLRSRDGREAVELARSHNLAYVFRGETDAAISMAAMHATMPEDLKAWHLAGRDRAFMPPDVAWAWSLAQGIADFYRYAIRGDSDGGVALFREAMGFLSRASYRRFAEALHLGGMETVSIQAVLREAQCNMSIDVLEYYFHNFFDATWMSEYDALRYCARINDAAVAGLSNYVAEARAKRWMVLHPFDFRSAITYLGLQSSFSNAFLLQAVKATAYQRMMEASSPHTTMDRALLLQATDETYKSGAGVLISCIALESKVGDSLVVEDGAKAVTVLLEQRKERLELTAKITEAEIINNHAPPVPVLESDVES